MKKSGKNSSKRKRKKKPAKKQTKSRSKVSRKPRKNTPPKPRKKPRKTPKKKPRKKPSTRASVSFPFGKNLPPRDKRGRFLKKPAKATDRAIKRAAEIIADAERFAAQTRELALQELEQARIKAVRDLEKSAGAKLAELSTEDRQLVIEEAVFQILDAEGGRPTVNRRFFGGDIVDMETGEVLSLAEWQDILAQRKMIAVDKDYLQMAEAYEMSPSEIFSLFMSP